MRDVYFIRHKWNEQWNTIVDYLFDKRLIAIHFDNNLKWDPKKYTSKGPKSAFNALTNLSATGGIVIARYQTKDEALIGEIAPGATKEIHDRPDSNGSLKELKILQLQNWHSFTINEFSLPFLLSAGQGTISRWHMAEKAVNAVYNHITQNKAGFSNIKQIPPSMELLSGWHYEVLCEEWLREKNIISRKLFKTGGSLACYDLVAIGPAINNSQIIYCQVKYDGKDADFKKFADGASDCNALYYFFASEANKYKLNNLLNSHGNKTRITLESIETVYDYFYKKTYGYLQKLIFP